MKNQITRLIISRLNWMLQKWASASGNLTAPYEYGTIMLHNTQERDQLAMSAWEQAMTKGKHPRIHLRKTVCYLDLSSSENGG